MFNSKVIIMILLMFAINFKGTSAIHFIHVDATSGTGNRAEGTGWSDAVNLDTLSVMTITPPAVIYIRGDGTPNGDVNISLQDGSEINPILMTGVLSATTDEGSNITYSSFTKITDTASMPLLNFSVYNFQIGDWYRVRGLSIISAKTGVLSVGASCGVYECWIRNNYTGTAGRNCVTCGNYLYIHNSIFSAPAAHGIYPFPYGIIENSTFIDFTDDQSLGRHAIWLGGGGVTIKGCKFKNCKIGIELGTQDYVKIFDNTFYSGGTFINATDAHHCNVSNNVVYDQNAKFAVWTTQTDANTFYNNHTTNINDFTLVDTNSYFRDFELTTGDPLIDTITLTVDDSTSVIYRDPESSAP